MPSVLIRTVCDQFEAQFAPALTSSSDRVALDMGLALLRAVACRVEGELGWMHAEEAATEQLAERLLTMHPDPAVADALAQYRSADMNRTEINALYARYSLSGEILSRVAEATYGPSLASLRNEVRAVLEMRRWHDNLITGGYEAVGRT